MVLTLQVASSRYPSTSNVAPLVLALEPGTWLDLLRSIPSEVRGFIAGISMEHRLVARDDPMPLRDLHPWSLSLMSIEYFERFGSRTVKFSAIEHVVLGVLLGILIRRRNLDVVNADDFQH